MGLMMKGTVKNCGVYQTNGKDGSQRDLISFNVVDERGNTYSCQMWPDDPQHPQLVQIIPHARWQKVECEVMSYVVRMRDFKDGRPPAPQANFIVSRVVFPELAAQSGMAPAGAAMR